MVHINKQKEGDFEQEFAAKIISQLSAVKVISQLKISSRGAAGNKQVEKTEASSLVLGSSARSLGSCPRT
jgi:hypothetical protein